MSALDLPSKKPLYIRVSKLPLYSHVLKRSDGIYQQYRTKKKTLGKEYRQLPRTRALQRQFGKRVRAYEKIKLELKYYRSMYVVNAQGSGRLDKKCVWRFTVDATVYTTSPIDDERYDGLASCATALAEWLIDEFGFHNVTFDTVGGEVDSRVSREDSKGLGVYVVSLDVEDVQMASGDYRPGRNIRLENARMLAKSQRHEAYSVRGCQIIPRVAP